METNKAVLFGAIQQAITECQLADALLIARYAMRVYPYNAEFFYLAAQCYTAQAQADRALEYINMAIIFAPRDHRYRNLRAILFVREQHYAIALEDILAALKQMPGDVVSQMLLKVCEEHGALVL